MRKVKFLIILGILIICYPFLGRFIYKNIQNQKIDEFKKKIVQMDDMQLKKIKMSNNVEQMIGYIKIAKISVNIPIYEGTTDKVLKKGVGHVENTPLPDNFKDYHTILAGHTGISTSIIFDNISKLIIGDCFYVDIFDEEYKYEVYNIQKVLPDENEKLNKFMNRDGKFVTLVTCTPRYINSHRLLVTGKLV